MPDYIYIRDPQSGEVYRAAPGTPIPKGYQELTPEMSGGRLTGFPPRPDVSFQPGRAYSGTPDLPVEESFNPVEAVAGAGLGAAAGRAGVGLLRALARVRPFGAGRTGDVQRVSEAVRGAGTPLQPTGTLESLADVGAGPGGKAAMQAARRVEIDALAKDVARTQRAEFPNSADAIADDVRRLTQELADARRGAVRASGELRDTPGAVARLREKDEILADINRRLTTEQQAAFRESQDRYARGSELRRLFKSPGVFGGTAGFDQQALQAALLKRLEQSGILPEAFRRAVLRGGTPRTDTTLQLPFLSVRAGPARVGEHMTLGRLLSDPATPLGRALTGPQAQRLAALLGGLGGGALAGVSGQPGLSRWLRLEE